MPRGVYPTGSFVSRSYCPVCEREFNGKSQSVLRLHMIKTHGVDPKAYKCEDVKNMDPALYIKDKEQLEVAKKYCAK